MNDQLQNKLSEIITWIQSSAETVNNFASQEIPIFIQEYLSWIFWSNMVSLGWIIFALILSIIFGYLAIFKTHVKFDEWGNPDEIKDGWNLIKKIIFTALSLLMFMGFFFNISDTVKQLVKVKVAPRVVLVEAIKNLSK